MHIQIHMHADIHINHSYINVQLRKCLSVCVYVYVHAFMYVCLCARVYTCITARTQVL